MFKLFTLFSAILLLTGCRTVQIGGPVDLSPPGWTARTGQAVWRRPPDLELAGDLLVASAPGKTFLQFTKGHLPVVVARQAEGQWQVEFFSEKSFSGRGRPPVRVPWLHLAKAVESGSTPRGWEWSDSGAGWKFQNRTTGETIEGFFEE
jgi:hypothetical protein